MPCAADATTPVPQSQTSLTGFALAAGAARAETSTYLIDGEHAEARVAALGVAGSRSLAEVGIVVADLEPRQASALRALGLHLTPDHAVHTASLQPQAYPTPVPVESGASALHGRGLYGTGVTIAFVDTGGFVPEGAAGAAEPGKASDPKKAVGGGPGGRLPPPGPCGPPPPGR